MSISQLYLIIDFASLPVISSLGSVKKSGDNSPMPPVQHGGFGPSSLKGPLTGVPHLDALTPELSEM